MDKRYKPKKYYNNSLSFYFDTLNTNFDFEVSLANDIAIDVVKCTPPCTLMQGSSCPDVCTLTNENGCYIR